MRGSDEQTETLATVRKRVDLKPKICNLLEQMSLLSDQTQADIITDGIILVYVMNNTMPPDLAAIVKESTEHIYSKLVDDLDI